MAVANSKLVSRAGTRLSRTLLATAGDRLALQLLLWTGPPKKQALETETLEVTEVDAEDRIVASIIFDPDDRRAASLELLDRYARSDSSRWVPPAFFEFRRGVIDHDLDRIRAALPDDFFFHDHRRTGPGRIDGADAYLSWLATLFEQSPDAIIEPMYEVATAERGALTVGHTFGTLPEGGAFEFVWALVVLVRGDQIVGAELFEIEDLDKARARFEELGSSAAER